MASVAGEPQLSASPGCYSVLWPCTGADIVFGADRLRSHSDGRLQARVKVTAAVPGSETLTLSHGTLNLAANRSRRELSRTLEERLPRESINWDRVIEDSCRLILEREEEGAPVERLLPVTSLDTNYLLEPLLLEGLPVVLYAPGGAGKSYLALYIGLLIQNGLSFRGASAMQGNVLVMDWEVTQHEAARRCTLLAAGLERALGYRNLHLPLYRRCIAPLADEASEVAKAIVSNSIRLVVVDSAGPACGGDIASAETALHFFNALRLVTAGTKAASLVLTHTTKVDRLAEDSKRLPIGSVYFENLARLTWELRAEESNEENLRVGVFPRKWNVRRPEPFGFSLHFERERVLVEPAEAHDVMTEQGAKQAIILSELENGPLTVKELIELTGANPGAVRVQLTTLKQRGRVVNLSRGVWGLAEKSS